MQTIDDTFFSRVLGLADRLGLPGRADTSAHSQRRAQQLGTLLRLLTRANPAADTVITMAEQRVIELIDGEAKAYLCGGGAWDPRAAENSPAPACPPPVISGRRPFAHRIFQAVVLRVVCDLAWLWLQSRGHATMEEGEGQSRRMAGSSQPVFRELPSSVESDLLIAITNLLAGLRVDMQLVKLVIECELPADAAADLLGEIDAAIGHEMRTFVSWIGEGAGHAQ